MGEPFPVTARVFREGHDRLAAEVVLTGPDGKRRDPVRMVKHAEVPDLHTAWVTPDTEGAWTFEVQAWSDPIATWEHNADVKIKAGVDVDLMFTEGRLLLERVLAEPGLDHRDTTRRPRGGARRRHRQDARPQARLAALQDPELEQVLRDHPLRELVTVDGPFPAYADRNRALFGSWYEFFPRSEGATKDPATGKVTSGTFRTAVAALGARRPRWASTFSISRRSTPSARSTARARTTRSPPARTTPARRGRSAARRAATRRSIPTSARWRTSTPSSAGRTRSASRSRSTWRCRPPRTTPGRPSTRSSSPPAPTAPSPTRRTRRRSTRTSTP